MAMNNGERLLHTLEQYFALKQHQPNAAFQQRLTELQTWQIKRLFHTHQQRLATQEAHTAAHFLFYEVYGGANLPQVASNIQRATRKAMALLPSAVMHTAAVTRSEEHTSELQSRGHLVCRLMLEQKKHTHMK